MTKNKSHRIKGFEELVKPHLNGSNIKSYSVESLSKPMENYGSCMKAVTANIETSDGKKENKAMVAKMPPSSDFYLQMFCPERSFRSENVMYSIYIAALEDIDGRFQIPTDRSFLTIFPKCYGGRVNCKNEVGPVDQDALLVLENLIVSGYKPRSRGEFFQKEDTYFILKGLAKFHASSIVLRNLEPDFFQNIRNKHFKKFDLQANMGEGYSKKVLEVSKSTKYL